MSIHSMEYMRTGNNIDVTENELLDHMYKEFNRYDNLNSDTTNTSTYSPYTDTIIYETTHGKQIEVPQYIQKKAIDTWLLQKQQNNQDTTNINVSNSYVEQYKLLNDDISSENNNNTNNEIVNDIKMEESEIDNFEIDETVSNDYDTGNNITNYDSVYDDIIEPIGTINNSYNTNKYILLIFISCALFYYIYKCNISKHNKN